MVYGNSGFIFNLGLTASLLTGTAGLAHSAVNGEQQWISDETPDEIAGEVIDQRMSASGQFIVFTRAATGGVEGGSGHLWNRTNNSTTTVANPDVVTAFFQADVDNAGNVVFVTSNALDIDDTNGTLDVYYTVPASGEYTLLSRLPGGGAVGNGASQNPRISTDGRYVVFESQATNFSGFNDFNDALSDVFRVNVQSGDMALVSRAASKLTPPSVPLSPVEGVTGNGASTHPDISADGRYVAYQSSATDLNREVDNNGADIDVVVRDMDGTSSSAFTAFYDAQTVSVFIQSNSESISPGISESGDAVVFKTQEPLDRINDTNTEWDVYTSQNGFVTLQTQGLNGQALGGEYGNRLELPSVDGPAVWSTVNAITPDDVNQVSDIYVNQADAVTTGEDPLIELASADDESNTSAASSNGALLPAVSADGRYVSYITRNNRQSALQSDANGRADVYIFDRGLSYCDSFLEYNQFTIASDQWHQLALPCHPPEGSTVADIFGDDLPGAPFDPRAGADNTGVVWAAYIHNATLNRTEALTLDSELRVGTGFWIRQNSGAPVTLDMPGNSWQSASTTKFNAACVDTFHGCSAIQLSGANSEASVENPRWNMSGNPFGGPASRNIDNIRVVLSSDIESVPCQASTDPGDSAPGCDLNEAYAADVLAPIFFHWNPEAGKYDILSRSDTSGFGPSRSELSPWQGVWIAELSETSGRQIRLIVPED